MVSLLRNTSDPLCKKIGLLRYNEVMEVLKPKVRSHIAKGFTPTFTAGEVVEAADERSENVCDNIIEEVEDLIRVPGLGDHTVAVAISEVFPERKNELFA